ncbi:TolB protein [Paucidesulfovibrio gracilis DSM 16080]|uniref:TolB protein n=1 Tax=Paucidesulfovibrio gracilis DSM 16080 TaxID=1121449 RepID=A0A1T4WJZ7_9BACT|nr:protein tolB [Paucidesulfovibrio gracilis]SKA77654.1 TolB protein [Paucidesulfovibrio gracilis DSM 16080]
MKRRNGIGKGMICVLALGVWILAGMMPVASASAQSPGVSVDIFGPGQGQLNLVVLSPRGLDGGTPPDLAAVFEEAVQQNLNFLPFVQMVAVDSLLGGDPSTGVRIEEIDLKPLRLAKVDLVVTMGWEDNNLQARVYDTLNGRRLVGKAYPELDRPKTPLAADAFCAAFMKALTGRNGFFNSDLAYVGKVSEGREIFVVSPQGRERRQLTKLGGINLSPAWDNNGDRIVFTHVGEKSHSLGIVDRATGKTRMRSFPGYTVIGPDFLPNGDMAVTLSIKGRPDIYRLNRAFQVQETLAASHSIDVSPSFDQKGIRMAFVSDRRGNPHIFLKEMLTGQVRRVTHDGKYNTSPCMSPDGRYVAFSRQVEGRHRIFVHDLMTGQERQITFGPGNDEEPAFGPDGYFIAFSSSRSGTYQIYLTTRHADQPKLVPTGSGEATAPAWDTSRIQY